MLLGYELFKHFHKDKNKHHHHHGKHHGGHHGHHHGGDDSAGGPHPPKKPKHSYDIGGWIMYVFKYVEYMGAEALHGIEAFFVKALDFLEGSTWILVAGLFWLIFTDNPIRSVAISGGSVAMNAAPMLLL